MSAFSIHAITQPGLADSPGVSVSIAQRNSPTRLLNEFKVFKPCIGGRGVMIAGMPSLAITPHLNGVDSAPLVVLGMSVRKGHVRAVPVSHGRIVPPFPSVPVGSEAVGCHPTFVDVNEPKCM